MGKGRLVIEAMWPALFCACSFVALLNVFVFVLSFSCLWSFSFFGFRQLLVCFLRFPEVL